ncbi:MAG TPA: TolC family protein [Pyrinomonadaceae bacterium]|jgi:HAE1 family hydrophobic/amphiphilic exporter-1|nr:TolC family protein [Pyrinomonadaceae bacterium]
MREVETNLRLRLGRRTVLALLLAVCSLPVTAQTPTPSSSPQELQVPVIAPDFHPSQRPLPDLGRVGVDMDRQRPLSLREALTMALENNKDIEVARHNVKIAEFDLTAARGAYDPRFNSSAYYERISSPISSFLSGGANGATTQSDYTGTARVEGLTPQLGGSYHLDFSSVRFTSNNQFTALSPQYPTSLTFGYTQPLFRGRKFDNNRRQIEIGKKNLSLTDAQFRQRAIETITSVQRAYWDLVFALRNLQVQRDAVRDSRAQLEHNKRLVAEGSLAPIDVVAAEAQVASFEQTLFSSLEDVSRSENNLKNLIAVNHQADLWSLSIIPTDSVDLVPPEISLPEALKAALENRPELQQSNVVREINQIDQKYFREQAKPAIDLVGSYGLVGLAGTQSNAGNPFTSVSNQELRDRVDQLLTQAGLPILTPLPAQALSPFLIGGYDQSLQNLFSNRFNNFRVGVQVNLPLRNRTAEAQLGRSLVEGERIATQREQLEQTIQVDVRNALQSVRSAEARLRAAGIARQASEQQYQSEQRKLDAGQSTVFLVLERQTALTTARGNELRAQTDLNKAIAELQRATGNALTTNNIVVRVR